MITILAGDIELASQVKFLELNMADIAKTKRRINIIHGCFLLFTL